MRHALLVALLLLGCGEDKPAPDNAPPSGVDPNLRIGHVMVEVGQRFETAGRAANAERWGLAEYQAQEILEMFEMDMTRALLPGGCNDDISDSMYNALLDEQLPALRAAAAEEDDEAFAAQFRTVSQSCNGCHAGCEVGFVQVPDTPGAEVPWVEAEGASEPEPEPDSEPAPAPDSEPAPEAEPVPEAEPAPGPSPDLQNPF